MWTERGIGLKKNRQQVNYVPYQVWQIWDRRRKSFKNNATTLHGLFVRLACTLELGGQSSLTILELPSRLSSTQTLLFFCIPQVCRHSFDVINRFIFFSCSLTSDRTMTSCSPAVLAQVHNVSSVERSSLQQGGDSREARTLARAGLNRPLWIEVGLRQANFPLNELSEWYIV